MKTYFIACILLCTALNIFPVQSQTTYSCEIPDQSVAIAVLPGRMLNVSFILIDPGVCLEIVFVNEDTNPHALQVEHPNTGDAMLYLEVYGFGDTNRSTVQIPDSNDQITFFCPHDGHLSDGEFGVIVVGTGNDIEDECTFPTSHMALEVHPGGVPGFNQSEFIFDIGECVNLTIYNHGPFVLTLVITPWTNVHVLELLVLNDSIYSIFLQMPTQYTQVEFWDSSNGHYDIERGKITLSDPSTVSPSPSSRPVSKSKGVSHRLWESGTLLGFIILIIGNNTRKRTP